MVTDSSTDASTGWERTIAAANERAAELDEDGWEVVTVRAGHTAPVAPESGDADRWGFVYVAPGDVADRFRDLHERGDFSEYTVYRRYADGTLFALTEITDPEKRIAVLLVGGVDMSEADRLLRAANERGEMYSHVQLLDETHLGSFHHDDPSLFFGDTDE